MFVHSAVVFAHRLLSLLLLGIRQQGLSCCELHLIVDVKPAGLLWNLNFYAGWEGCKRGR